jgi:glycerophosphoryl diester phosphodiesterase
MEYKDIPSSVDIELLRTHYENMAQQIIFISFKKDILAAINRFKIKFPFLKDSKIIMLQKYAYNLALKYDGLQAKYINKSQIWLRHKLKDQLIGEYTVDSTKKMKQSLKKGIDFITTNYPRICMEEVRNFIWPEL